MKNSFFDLLSEVDAGIFESKIEEAAKNVALMVQTHQKKGQVVLTFDINPTKHSDMQVELKHKIKFVKPTMNGKQAEENETGTLVYVGGRGNMSILPESQSAFDFDKETGEIK